MTINAMHWNNPPFHWDGPFGKTIIVSDGVPGSIQDAIDDLTSGRTKPERVLVIGDYTITSTITLPAYTTLEIQGSLTATDNFTSANMIEVSASSFVEIMGGTIRAFNAARDNQTNLQNCIKFEGCSDFKVKNCHVINAQNHGISIDSLQSTGAKSRNFEINSCKIEGSGDDHVSILERSYDGIITGCVMTGGLSDTGATGGIEIEDGSYQLSITNNILYSNIGNGIGVITDANNTENNTSIIEIGSTGEYTVTTSTSHNIGVGETIYIGGTTGFTDGLYTVNTVPSLTTLTITHATGSTITVAGTTEHTWGACHDITIVGNVISDMVETGTSTAGSGVSFQSSSTVLNDTPIDQCYGISVIGNTVSGCEDCNIICSNSKNCTISGNSARGSLEEDGIKILNCISMSVCNNLCSENFRHGINVFTSTYVNVTGNTCADNDSGDSAITSGINIQPHASVSNTSGKCLVVGNICTNTTGTSPQYAGITLTRASDIIVANNVIDNNQTRDLNLSNTDAAGCYFGYNEGLTTKGSATLLNGNTSIVVTHGLGSGTGSNAPSPDNIKVHPIETLGSASFWWVDTITDTQFTINVNADPGADVDFAWSIV